MQTTATVRAPSVRETAERFVASVSARDRDALLADLAANARFRFLIPPGPGDGRSAADAVDRLMEWFGDADVIRVEDVRVEAVGDRTSVAYRFALGKGGAWYVVQQQLFLDVDEDGRIEAMDLLCSGFRPAEDPDVSRVAASRGAHRFDAGTMGCADGLAREFRRQVLAIPVGDVLEVETSDPAAKEDLPPLARMLGHTVRSIEPTEDGRLLITVERGR